MNITTPSPEIPNSFAEDALSLKERVGNFEKAIILAALEKTDWNQKKAAQLLSVNATTLSEKLKRFKIREQLKGSKDPRIRGLEGYSAKRAIIK